MFSSYSVVGFDGAEGNSVVVTLVDCCLHKFPGTGFKCTVAILEAEMHELQPGTKSFRPSKEAPRPRRFMRFTRLPRSAIKLRFCKFRKAGRPHEAQLQEGRLSSARTPAGH